jgi:hypothetical protein
MTDVFHCSLAQAALELRDHEEVVREAERRRRLDAIKEKRRRGVFW